MSQPPHKIPRLRKHRDVADLLKCLPDRKFAYRIFDAASGQVLRSVSGEDDTWSDEADDDTPVRPSEVEPSLRHPAPSLSQARRADVAPLSAPPLPRPPEAPAPARTVATAPVGARREHDRSAAGAIAAMLTSEPPRQSLFAATRDTRSVLGSLQRRQSPWSSAAAAKPTFAQIWANTIERRGASRRHEPRSTAQLLARLSAAGVHGGTAALRRSTGSVAATIVARGVAGAAEASTPAGKRFPAGSAAALLRGALRH